jgi:hypothetical protein
LAVLRFASSRRCNGRTHPLPAGEGVHGNPLIQSKADARRAAMLAALPLDVAALYGFFVSVAGAAPLVVVCVAVVCGAAASPGAADVVAVVVCVVVVSVGDAELVVCVVVEAGTGSAGSFGFARSHAMAATTSSPVAIIVSFFMYSLLVHTIGPCALKDLTAI